METPIIPDIEDMQLLKAATTQLLKHAFKELNNNKFSPEDSVFGKAAPVATLEGLARLLVTFSQLEGGNAPSAAAMLSLSDADVTLMKSLALRARQRHLEQLPAPESK